MPYCYRDTVPIRIILLQHNFFQHIITVRFFFHIFLYGIKFCCFVAVIEVVNFIIIPILGIKLLSQPTRGVSRNKQDSTVWITPPWADR